MALILRKHIPTPDHMALTNFLQKNISIQVLDFVNIILGAEDESKHAVALLHQ